MFKFINNDYKEAIESRYWSANGFSLAIIASVTKGVDWAAYIGADQSANENETLNFVKGYGCKLIEEDARHFFPDIELPYRR